MPTVLTEVFATLGLDGRLFLAQLVNVLLVFLILWRWVFKPLGARMRDREARIQAGLEQAETIEKERESLKRERERQRKALEREANQLERAARDRAEAEARQLLEDAKAQARQLLAEAEARAAHEHAAFLQNAQEELARAAVAITETLIGKGTAKRQRELIDEALKTLEHDV